MPLAVEFLSRAGVAVHAGFGRLYLLNTLGGALGATLAPFVLVPALGVRGSLVFAAALSLLVGSVALRFAREAGPIGARQPEPALEEPPPSPGAGTLGPALAFASGAATFGLEVLWTRSYALVIGSTVYAFGLVLLAVLLGIAAGSAAYAAWRPRIVRPARTAGVLFIGAGLAALAGAWAIGRLPVVLLWALGHLPLSFGVQQLAFLALGLATLLPIGVALGVTFPLLLHLALPAGGAQRAAGRLYAWNTAGAIAGALAADLVLVPRLGLQPPYLVFAGLLVAGGAWALASAARRAACVGPLAALVLRRRRVRGRAPLQALGPRARHVRRAPLRAAVDPPARRSGAARRVAARAAHAPLLPRGGGGRGGRVGSEGRRAPIPVRERQDRRRQRDRGRRHAEVHRARAAAAARVAAPRARDRLGGRRHGGGRGRAPARAARVRRDRAGHLAGGVLSSRSSGTRCGSDPRFAIVFRDGRNHLLRSPGAFDVIASEPSNPWITGVSNLFTREFLETARDRLAPGGLFAQWFHYYNLEPADVKVEIRTFLSVFPHASLWLVPPVGPEDGIKSLGADMLLVGSREPQRLDWPRLEGAFADTRLGPELRKTLVLDDALALAATWTMGRPELERFSEDRAVFPRGTPLNTDDNPYLEFVAPRRTLMRPSEAARQATAQYAAMGAAAGDPRDVLAGVPALAQGGAPAATFLRELAERHVAAVQPERAVKALAAASAANPDDADAHARAAELLVERGRPREAEKRYAEVVRIDPSRASAWEAIGGIALDLRDYERAEQAHRALLRLEPGKVSAWLRLAAVLARRERWSEARDAIARAQALDPKAAGRPPAGRVPRPEAQRKLRISIASRLSFPADTTRLRLSGSQRTANTSEEGSAVTWSGRLPSRP